jgi:HAD superfamily hydrolase (TIGR01490 family)
MSPTQRLAFYDFDGTLTSGNIVWRYAYFTWRDPSRFRGVFKFARLLLRIPSWLALESRSRREFNVVFFREYRGMREKVLRALSQQLFNEEILPSIYKGARSLLEDDRQQGYLPVLVSGELDVALEQVIRYLGFQAVISNRLVFKNGVATGEVEAPLIAEEEKVCAMENLCRQHGTEMKQCKAYSDSFSDLPMLEAVGIPAAVHPDRRLKRVAQERGWTILDLKRGIDVKRHREQSPGGAPGV